MNTRFALLLQFLAAAIVMLAPLSAGAITSVTPSPGTRTVAIGASAPTIVAWSVSFSTGNQPPIPATLISTQGVFRAGGAAGPVLATVPRTLSRAILAGNGPSTETFTEGVQVPQEVTLEALQLGFNLVVYQRTFGLSGTPFFCPVGGCMPTGTLVFNITGSSGAGFSVNRISLRFPDDSRVTVHPRREPLHALADLTFNGTGHLEAVWEVAEPTSTAGNPIFRPLRLERRQLIGAQQLITLKSPDLPTQDTGIHLVRLRVSQPLLAFASPIIRYFVNPGLAPQLEPERLTQVSPSAGAAVGADATFRWEGLKGAVVYQLEFHDREFGVDITRELTGPNERDAAQRPSLRPEPVAKTGIVVSSEATDTALSEIVLSRLRPQQTYWWRVLAFDSNGRLVGQSELRPVVFTSTQSDRPQSQSQFRPKGTTGQGATGLPIQLPELGSDHGEGE